MRWGATTLLPRVAVRRRLRSSKALPRHGESDRWLVEHDTIEWESSCCPRPAAEDVEEWIESIEMLQFEDSASREANDHGEI